jgi:hypothetical protein
MPALADVNTRALQWFFTCVYIALQGDSGRKVNILGGDSIGHCEKKSLYGHVSISERLPR